MEPEQFYDIYCGTGNQLYTVVAENVTLKDAILFLEALCYKYKYETFGLIPSKDKE